MLQYKTSKTDFDTQKIGSFNYDTDSFVVKDWEKAQKFAAMISQTPFAYRDYATTLYAQFGLPGAEYKYNKVKINNPDKLFKSLVCSMFYYYEQPAELRTLRFTYKKGNNDGVKNDLTTITNGAQLAALISQIYGLGVGENIRNIAKKIAAARQDHHSAFFLEDSPERSSRTSVRSSIERSPHREDDDVTQGSLARSSEEMGVPQSEDGVMNHKYTSRDIARLFKQVLVEENQNPLATFTLDEQDNAPVENLVFRQGNTFVLPPLGAIGGLLIDSIKTLLDHPSAQTHQPRMILVPYNPGGHWVTLRINIPENGDMTIEYVDSLINEEEAVNQSRIESANDSMGNLMMILKQQIPAFSTRTITQAVITPRIQYNEIDCGVLTVANVIDSVNGVPLPNNYLMNPDEIKTIKQDHRCKLQQMGEDFEFEEGHQEKVRKVKLPVGAKYSDRETSPEPQKPTMSSRRVLDSTQSVSTNSSQKSSSKRKFDHDEIALYARNNPSKTQKAIAEYFGCSPSTVSRAINGK